jgi:hypothetical protein
MGCSGGSFFFARTWTLRVLKPIQQDPALDAQPLAIHDDLYIACEIERLGAVSQRVQQLTASVGISLNLSKSFYFQWPPLNPDLTNTLSHSCECRTRLQLLPDIPVRDWGGLEGGFLCNGTPTGAPHYVKAQLEKLVDKFKDRANVLLGLTGCTIQTGMLLHIYCVHTQMLHLLRGIPPSDGLAGARDIVETMRITVATITYTDPTLLEEAHNNKALARLRLPPTLGGAGLSALASTNQAAYTGSIAGCLVRLSALPLLSAGCARDPGPWDDRPDPLGAVYEAWHRGIAGPPLSSYVLGYITVGISFAIA